MEEILRLIYGDKHCRAHHNRNRREIVDGAQLCAIVASTGGEEARLGREEKGERRKKDRALEEEMRQSIGTQLA